MCSLIEAIQNANDDALTHADCRVSGSGADTIVLPQSSTQVLTQVLGNGGNGLPAIRSTITIEGNGSTIRRRLFPPVPRFRIFAVSRDGNLTLNNTTVRGGAATRTFVVVGGVIVQVSDGNGGGIHVDRGVVTIRNSTIARNSTATDGAPSNGGGVYNCGLTVTFTNSTVSGNTASGGGGGVFNCSERETLTGDPSRMTLTNSTVSGNSAGSGGGIRNGGIVTLARSLVSGNSGGSGGEFLTTAGSALTANSFNLFGHSGLSNAQAFSRFTPGATDLVATSNGDVPTTLGAILDTTLANNIGPTQTHELVAGSPAIDGVGTGCPPPATDQRGVIRPQGPRCDIGAFEIIPRTADLALSLTDEPDPLTVDGRLVYTVIVRNNGPETATGVQVTDTLPEPMVLPVPAISTQGDCFDTRTVICELGELNPGDQATVTMNVIPTETGVFSNTASVAGGEPDPVEDNDSMTVTTTVQPPSPTLADLAVTVAVTPDPGAAGQESTYALTARNEGPQMATGVKVTADLPPGVGLGQVLPDRGSCGGTDPVLCELGALASGVSAIVTIDVVPTGAGSLTHQATVNGDQLDPNPGNNSASVTTTIRSPLALPTPRTASICNSVRCQLRLACNRSELLGRNCDNEVTLFVRAASARRVAGALAKAKKPIKFAAGVANVPPNQSKNVKLKLRPKGSKLARTLIRQGKKTLRGEMRISNAAGGIDIIRLTVRLK